MLVPYTLLFWVLVSLLITVHPAAENDMAWFHVVMCGSGLLLTARAVWRRRARLVFALLLALPTVFLFGLLLYFALTRIL